MEGTVQTKKIDQLSSEIALDVLLVGKTAGCAWWFTENGTNWWNRRALYSMDMLYYIVEGQFHLKVEDIWYTLQQGDLVYIPAGKRLEYRIDGDAPLVKYYMHFNIRIGHVRPIREFGSENILKISESKEVLSDFEIVRQWHVEKTTDCFSVYAAVMRLISHFSAQPSQAIHGDVERRLEDAVSYMAQNYSEKLRVSDLAARAGFTADYFGKKFHQRYGCSSVVWLNRLRIQKAQQLLAATDQSVADVAEQVGFSDSSYFSRLFKETVGLYPVKFRHLVRANQP